jgi:hypothetical protein
MRPRIDGAGSALIGIGGLVIPPPSLRWTLFSSLFLGSVLLLSTACNAPKKDDDGISGDPGDGQAEQQEKRVSEAEVLEAAKRYVRVFFQRHELVGGGSAAAAEADYFTDGIFRPHTEYDETLGRWAVTFSDGMTGSSIVIEMNPDATKGCLVTSWLDIPEIPRGNATGADKARPALVGITEFREAVDRVVHPTSK